MKTDKNRNLRKARSATSAAGAGAGLARAVQAYSAGDLATAEREAALVLSAYPQHVDAINLAGVVAAGRGNPARAVSLLEQAVHLQPRSGSMRANLALALKMLGRWRDAVVHAREGVRLEPANAGNWNTLAAAQHELGEHATAGTAGRIAIALDPIMAEAWCNLANTLAELEEPLAGPAYRAALALQPRLPQAWSGFANVALHLGHKEIALAAHEQSQAIRLSSRWWPRGGNPSALPPVPTLTNTVKLRHDIEQLEAGRRSGLYGPDFDPIIVGYRRALDRFVRTHGATATAALHPDDVAAIGDVYGRIVHLAPPPRLPGAALAADWSRETVSRRYAVPPGITWIDGLLSAEALTSLRRFCLDATIWNDISHNFQASAVARGYLGAYAADGFLAPLLLQIADELRAALPDIFAGHLLRQMWAYKYEDRLEGIGIHGDDAAVNVNFWITPDEANLDPESGGLIVYPVEAPASWDFAAINTEPETMLRFVESSGVDPIVVPYRQNRAVIFNSDLFHATAPLRFKPGYENRRINVTMLFGRRQPNSASR